MQVLANVVELHIVWFGPHLGRVVEHKPEPENPFGGHSVNTEAVHVGVGVVEPVRRRTCDAKHQQLVAIGQELLEVSVEGGHR